MLPAGQQPWWSSNTLAVVTGANKGIGKEIARLLAQQGLTVILTARNEDAGKAAAAELTSSGVPGQIVFHQLDIASDESIAKFTSWFTQQYGKVTILVNNAGMAYKGSTFGADKAATTLATNFSGTAHLCEALKPHLADNARIVTVSSRAGLTGIVRDPALLRRITGAGSLAELQALADEYVGAIRRGTHRQEGWPDTMYGTSKLLVSMYTRLLAQELQGRGVMVNACCPGYCATDMSSWRGTKTAADGADTPVFLALRPPPDFVTGALWAERSHISF